MDSLAFVVAVVFGLVLAGARLRALPDPPWLFDVDQFAGVLGCLALWMRRRWPVHVALVVMALSTFSELISGAMLLSLFFVAVHRPPKVTLMVFGVSVAAATVYSQLRPEPELTPWFWWGFGVAVQGAAVGWGLYIHNRRELIRSERDRAVREARTEIAREMHDVLGHRLSLLSVHAGALEFNQAASKEDIARAATVIRESAHQALQDLREVIGVLRAPVDELPQPKFADLPELIADSRTAGMRVELHEDVPDAVPDRLGRPAYRIVQEALTNARKHAPGTDVRVRLRGAPGEGLTIEVHNTEPARPATPGNGKGLIGLAERVALAKGTLEHGPVTGGGWRVRACLPWPS
ncbi:histidine kinase [Actinocrispum sp. NPDC049592]|uniref:sensor histidine kinase n=1 Tax=Actinocrispum sp. NPDC049592 TaxID=3154835 RepID=UPI0034147106